MLTWIMIISALVLVGIDQLTKAWAISQLYHADRDITVIDGVFELSFLKNTGAAFGILKEQRWVFIVITLLIGGVLLAMMLRSPLRKYKLFNVTCVLILSGAIGNLIDRIVYGYVVDFLNFILIDFPVFNFADCCVVVGSGLLLVFVLFVMKEDDSIPMRTLLFGMQKKNGENSDA